MKKNILRTAWIGIFCAVSVSWPAPDVVAEERPLSSGTLSVDTAGEDVVRAREQFAHYGLSLSEKQDVYRALKALGHVGDYMENPDFFFHENTISAVRDYQTVIGAKVTGYLKKYQVRMLLRVVREPARMVGSQARLGGEHPVKELRVPDLGCGAKREIYRGLYALGFVSRRTAFPDFQSDEMVVAGVSNYQRSIGANPTGQLTMLQVSWLRQDAGKAYLWEQKGCDPDRMLFPLHEWYAAGYTPADKQDVFDILEEQGFLTGDRLSNSFTDRDNKAAVKLYQAGIGAEQTGYLTNRQADAVLHGWQAPDPRQQWVALSVSEQKKRDLFRVLFAMGYVKDAVPVSDFAVNEHLIQAVSSFQSLAGYPSTGFLTQKQVNLLLARPIRPTPFEQAQTAGISWSNPVLSWVYEDYAADDLKMVYRALYNRGFFFSDAVTADLTRPDLVDHIRRYQAYVAADPTGYLSRRQLEDLLADPGKPTPWESRQKQRQQAHAGKQSDTPAYGREDWEKLGYSTDQKKQLYRALYNAGLAQSAEMVTDFSLRLDLIKVVRAYQEQNGFEPTGFLTSGQAETLLGLEAPLLPSEKQAGLFGKYGSSPVLGYFRDLGRQEFGISKPVSTIVKRLQGRFGLRVDGYVSEELFKLARSIPLKVVREPRPAPMFSGDVEKLSVSKDWVLWKEHEVSLCETLTSSIYEDGFTASAAPSSVSLYRGSDWQYNAVNTSVQLENWKPETLAEIRVGGRSFYARSLRGQTRLMAKDGSKPDSPGKNYSNFINALLRANGFEIIYETVFGTRVVASFSALGLTRQLRAMKKAC